MKIVLVGTDHRLQQTIVQDEQTKAWVPRNGGNRYRKLVAFCVERLGVKAIFEESHPKQEQTAPTIASTIAKRLSLPWQSLGLGQPGLGDALLDPPPDVAIRCGVKPELLAGVYALNVQRVREEFMGAKIIEALRQYDCVLAVVGYVHLGVLARMFEGEGIPVEAFLFTYPLVVDEARS